MSLLILLINRKFSNMEIFGSELSERYDSADKNLLDNFYLNVF